MSKIAITSCLLIRMLLLGVLVSFLSACASSPVRVESRATDLEVMYLGVKAMAKPRQPAGDLQHVDEAKTNGELMDIALDLQDVKNLSNADKQSIAEFVRKSLLIITSSRQDDCGWFGFRCRREQAAARSPFEPPETAPDAR